MSSAPFPSLVPSLTDSPRLFLCSLNRGKHGEDSLVQTLGTEHGPFAWALGRAAQTNISIGKNENTREPDEGLPRTLRNLYSEQSHAVRPFSFLLRAACVPGSSTSCSLFEAEGGPVPTFQAPCLWRPVPDFAFFCQTCCIQNCTHREQGLKGSNVKSPPSQLLAQCPGLSLPGCVTLDRSTCPELYFLHLWNRDDGGYLTSCGEGAVGSPT